MNARNLLGTVVLLFALVAGLWLASVHMTPAKWDTLVGGLSFFGLMLVLFVIYEFLPLGTPDGKPDNDWGRKPLPRICPKKFLRWGSQIG